MSWPRAPRTGEADPFPRGGCAAGVSGLTLLPDGTILPCRRLPVPLGNVRRDRLREVWSASPVLDALRDKTRYSGDMRLVPPLGPVPGLPGHRLRLVQGPGNPDFLAPDPQCFFTD